MDLTPLQWRVFWNGLLLAPFLIATFINGFISEAFIPEKWRWGLGMFAIMMPILIIPAIWALYRMQIKAYKLGVIRMANPTATGGDDDNLKGPATYLCVAWQGIIDIDLAGIILLGFSWSLILLPLNLAQSANGGWENASL